MPHVTRALCNRHVPHESASVWGRNHEGVCREALLMRIRGVRSAESEKGLCRVPFGDGVCVLCMLVWWCGGSRQRSADCALCAPNSKCTPFICVSWSA